ncbi:TLR4 [Branchiostoma lanceolatum]|uniref:TLR4 protein n=1 Tax=Branchiostoma lanceolatum TaxID=7740 RepID=A0A8J9YT16_BRALA|nr:TLR4 [Branchiostoma lanceolatum]
MSAPNTGPGPTPAPNTSPGPTSAPNTSPGPTSAPNTGPGPTSAPNTSPGPTSAPNTSPRPTSAPNTSPGPTSAPNTGPGPTSAPNTGPGPTFAPNTSPGPTPAPNTTAGPTSAPNTSPGPTSTPTSEAPGEDQVFVVRELASGLEERDFKLCLEYRDFPAGACKATTIIEAVEASRQTIFLLSQSFVDCEWCALAFKAAHQQMLKDKQNRIVVVVSDDRKLQHVDKDLKFYLMTNKSLKWGEAQFWGKLSCALSRAGRPIHNPEDHLDVGIEMANMC